MTDAAFWDKIAPKYAQQPIKDLTAYETTLERTKNYLHESDHVLELGCGTGSTAVLLAPLVSRYTATDISPKMVEIGQGKAREANVPNLEFKAVDWANPKLLDHDFDVVLALNLLHLLPDLPTVLRRIHTLMPAGGYFISKTTVQPQNGAPLSYWLIRSVLPILKRLGKVPYVAFHKSGALEQMMKDAGFEIVETMDAPVRPPNHYVVARKL